MGEKIVHMSVRKALAVKYWLARFWDGNVVGVRYRCKNEYVVGMLGVKLPSTSGEHNPHSKVRNNNITNTFVKLESIASN